MELEKIIKNLQKFGYKYSVKGEVVIVKLDFSHTVTIQQNDDKIVINDKLIGWNFLTGVIEMSLKNSIIYNFIGIIIFGFLCLYSSFQLNFELECLFILFISWIILFSVYYLIKFESFKQQIIYWISV